MHTQPSRSLPSIAIGADAAARLPAASASAGGRTKAQPPPGRVYRGSPAGIKAEVLPARNRKDPSAPLPPLSQQDMQKGVMTLMERGMVPNTFDLSAMVSGQLGAAPVAVSSVKLHKHVEQYHRHDILTANFGMGALSNVKMDISEVEKLNPAPPPKPVKPPAIPKVHQPTPAPTPPQLPGDKEKEREDVRTYTELLDMYSLHEFIIRAGVALRATPEFLSYQRSYQHMWGAILHVIGLLEALLKESGVALAYIDGKKVAALAKIDVEDPTNEQLLDCIANRNELEELLASKSQKFMTASLGHNRAAIAIQSTLRMWRQRAAYQRLLQATGAARLIQRQWHIHKMHMGTRKTLKVQRDAMLHRWRETMDTFVKNWSRIKTQRRVIIHLPSLSYHQTQCQTVPFFSCYQASQLARLADLRDENVEIIFLSPFQIETEALKYYKEMLHLAGINQSDRGSRAETINRCLVLWPENAKRLPAYCSLTKAVLFSQRLMKRLASMIKGKQAYIVPNVVGPEELQLASRLNVPLYAPEPKVAQVTSTKSGAKVIFEQADSILPVGAHNLRTEAETMLSLARCIAEYPEYPRWLIKIDTEFGGRGVAYVDVRKLKSMEEPAETQQQLMERVYTELRDLISKRVKIVNTNVYPDWASFMKVFASVGGCIEAVPSEVLASPTAHVLIEPDGTVNVTCVQEQILSPQYCSLGVVYPPTTVPYEAVRDAAVSIAKVCFKKRIIGHLSIDFVVFHKSDRLRMWAVDLDLHLSSSALMHNFYCLVSGAVADPDSGILTVRRKSGDVVPVCYAYSGMIYHPFIGALRHAAFFNICREKGLSFDKYNGTGVVFQVVANLLRGCVGVFCSADSEMQASGLLLEAIELIQSQLTSANVVIDDSETNFTFALTAVRNVYQRWLSERKGIDGSRRRSNKSRSIRSTSTS